ncbi:MAG: DUF1275 domain-containing protein [Polyangiaceae bacterium]|jgi:uncharacterized membrane protein YoaK (UPF0700 family)|nr:DUF1275 domain-containing protein [Polyangiaceae bacterium]
MASSALFTTNDDFFAPRHLLGWLGFSLTAGCVNAGAFLACRNFVSHVTGMTTSVALDVGRPTLALEYALVLAAFILGAAVATLVAETLKSRREASFALPVLLSFLALLGVAVAGRSGVFGAFGSTASETGGQANFAMLGALAASMGLLNASVALATSNAIRSTHLTGHATDLAVNLVRAALGSGEVAARELRWALLRATKVVAFALGGVLAATCADRLQYDVFLVAAIVLVVALCLTITPGHALEVAPASRGAHGDASPDANALPRRRPPSADGARPPRSSTHGQLSLTSRCPAGR